MTKILFNLSSISSSFEFLSVNQTSIYENSESNAFKYLNFFSEISYNWPKYLFGTNVFKILEILLTILQLINTTSANF